MITARVNASSFRRALRLYAAARKDKDYPYILNRAARNAAMWSANKTPQADAGRISHVMGQVRMSEIAKIDKSGNYVRRKKPRTVTKWAGDFTNSFAARIINARRRNAGEEMIWGKALESAAKRMIAARRASVSFIRAGWLPAIKLLKRAVSDSKGAPVVMARQKGQDKGYGIKAIGFTLKPKAVIANSAEGAAKIAGEPMQEAVRHVIKDMTRFAVDRLRESARKAGFRTN